MRSQGSSSGLFGIVRGSKISSLLLSMVAMMSTMYIAGRLWQDAENRVHLIKELDKRIGQGQSAVSVEDTLKIITCKDQHKRLSVLEAELSAANKEGFHSIHTLDANGTQPKRRFFMVIGITTEVGRRKNRDAIRRTWMPTGAALRKMEEERGIVIRFIIGKSAPQGNNTEQTINEENQQTKDFIILKDYDEGLRETSKKTKLFFAQAANDWDADFYAKVNDDVFINLDALVSIIRSHWQTPRTYIGCMKSGEVFSDEKHKWYEPDWQRFGDRKMYFRHASGQLFVMSRALAQFVSINKAILRTYAHDDISVGSWMIGLDVKHVDESKFCCSSWSPGAICAAV